MSAEPSRYGRRKISSMLNEWNELRAAVRSGDPVAIEHAFDACEEWVDFSFQHASNAGYAQGQADMRQAAVNCAFSTARHLRDQMNGSHEHDLYYADTAFAIEHIAGSIIALPAHHIGDANKMAAPAGQGHTLTHTLIDFKVSYAPIITPNNEGNTSNG